MTEYDAPSPLPPFDDSQDKVPPGDTAFGFGLDDQDALHEIFSLLRERTGQDFRQYKQATILRRIDRRMRARSVHELRRYQRLLEEDANEVRALLQDLLIGVTSFFRDRDAFAALEHQVVPRLFAGKAEGEELRAWAAACSTGEEAYSLGILLHERAAILSAPPRIQVFASDLDERAIQAGRAGVYPAAIAADIAPPLLERHFQLEGERYRVRQLLRDSVLFAEHNLLRDPAFSRLDLISCRNFLIYLNREHHRQVLELFHFALKPGGYLFLGSAESADAAAHLFLPVDAKHRLYQAKMVTRAMHPIPPRAPVASPRQAPATPASESGPRQRTLSYAEIHRRSAMRAAPPSILLDADAEILHIGDEASRYLRHAGGEPTRDIVALVAPELRLELRTALFQARAGGRLATTAPIAIGPQAAPRLLSISVQPAGDEEQDGLLLVQFHESESLAPAPGNAQGPRDALLLQLDEELRQTRRKLQDTIDQADAAGADARMANELLQSTADELSMALEEQRGSQEELQSANEELTTVNAQLRLKVEETAKAHDDLSNLIASTDIATIFLDRELRIQRYTPRVTDVFNMIPGDVGRPLAHLASRLEYPEMADDTASVLRTLQPVEREVSGRDDQCYIVRIHPYRTTSDRIEGAVMTFFDITRRRSAEQALRKSEERHRAELERLVAERTAELQRSRDLLQATMDSSMDMIQVFEAVRDESGRIVDFHWALNNHTSESRYGEVRGQSLLERNPGVVEEGIFDAFRRVTETGQPEQAEHHYVHEQFDSWYLQSVVKLGDGVATTTKDIGEWKRSQEELLRLRDEVAQARLNESQRALRVSERQLELAMAAAGMYAWQIDASGRLVFFHDVNRLTGLRIDDGSADQTERLDTMLAPLDREHSRRARALALRGEGDFHAMARLLDPETGASAWVEAHGTPVLGADGKVERVVGVGLNITERKRAEEALRSSEARHAFLLTLSDALRPLDESGDIVYTAARVLGEYLGSDRAYYVNLDEVREEFVVERDWHRPGETSHARRYPMSAWAMPWLADGRTWVVKDVDLDPILPDEQRPSYRGNGIRAAIVVPLIKGGRLVATFCTNQREARDWSATEVALIEDTAERIWAALRDSNEQLSLLLQK